MTPTTKETARTLADDILNAWSFDIDAVPLAADDDKIAWLNRSGF